MRGCWCYGNVTWASRMLTHSRADRGPPGAARTIRDGPSRAVPSAARDSRSARGETGENAGGDSAAVAGEKIRAFRAGRRGRRADQQPGARALSGGTRRPLLAGVLLRLEVSSTINFMLNQLFTYGEQREMRPLDWLRRAVKAQMASYSTLLLSAAISFSLTYLFRLELFPGERCWYPLFVCLQLRGIQPVGLQASGHGRWASARPILWRLRQIRNRDV